MRVSGSKVPKDLNFSGRPLRLSQQVAEELTGRIVGQEFPPGSTLPNEQILVEEFGVSRPVIREALKLVEQKRLVTIRQGEGTTVQARGQWNLLDPDVLRIALDSDEARALRSDVIQLRSDLEVSMLRRAASILTEADFEEMHELLLTMDTSKEPEALQTSDARFHDVISRASGNEIARTVVFLLVGEGRHVQDMGNPGPADYVGANRGHWLMFECLRAGDIDGAAEALSEHIHLQWLSRRPDQSSQR